MSSTTVRRLTAPLRTLFPQAAKYCPKEIVGMLEGRNSVNSNRANDGGQIPSPAAAEISWDRVALGPEECHGGG